MNPLRLISIFLTRLRFSFYDDKTYHNLRFFRNFGTLPNTAPLSAAARPSSYSEALLRLKLNHPIPDQQVLADKYRVREYVRERIGDEYLNELYAVYRRVSQIRYAELPQSFVLRCNHASGFNILVPRKSWRAYLAAKFKLTFWMLTDYSSRKREYQYRGIPRRIVCERYLSDESGSLRDYKLLCFGGRVRLIQLDTARQGQHTRAVLDSAWNLLPVSLSGVRRPGSVPPKPACLALLIELAEKLAAGLPFARVDFYLVNEKPVFGEITLHPNSGFSEFSSPEFSREVASWIPV